MQCCSFKASFTYVYGAQTDNSCLKFQLFYILKFHILLYYNYFRLSHYYQLNQALIDEIILILIAIIAVEKLKLHTN